VLSSASGETIATANPQVEVGLACGQRQIAATAEVVERAWEVGGMSR
jgi:hypothetical protein